MLRSFVRSEALFSFVLVNKVWLVNKVFSPGLSCGRKPVYTHTQTQTQRQLFQEILGSLSLNSGEELQDSWKIPHHHRASIPHVSAETCFTHQAEALSSFRHFRICFSSVICSYMQGTLLKKSTFQLPKHKPSWPTGGLLPGGGWKQFLNSCKKCIITDKLSLRKEHKSKGLRKSVTFIDVFSQGRRKIIYQLVEMVYPLGVFWLVRASCVFQQEVLI